MSAVNGMQYVASFGVASFYLSLDLHSQYLHYFNLDGENAGGGVGTPSALIFGIVSTQSLFAESDFPMTPVQYSIGSFLIQNSL